VRKSKRSKLRKPRRGIGQLNALNERLKVFMESATKDIFPDDPGMLDFAMLCAIGSHVVHANEGTGNLDLMLERAWRVWSAEAIEYMCMGCLRSGARCICG
jgi:hypothetical protein